MTPSLLGRWQTRLFLLGTVGVISTLPFALGWLGAGASFIYFWVLFYVALLGLGWDVLYDLAIRFSWDYDWPGILQLVAGVWEGLFLSVLLSQVGLPFLNRNGFIGWDFWLHYSWVWVWIYLSSWVVMRLLFPRWRHRGGEWIDRWPHQS